MSAENAKRAADDILSRLQLSPDEMSGQRLQLVSFESEEDCRFFYRRRALEWQRQVNTYISRVVRQKGMRVHRISLQPADYQTWRGKREDAEELRRQFADQHLRLLGEES